MSNKHLTTIIKIICFLIPFSLLIIAKGLLFPYITGKAIYFRVLVEIAVFLTIILLLKRKELLPNKKEYIFWSSLLLLLSMFILIPFSARPLFSFWGNAERMEGVWGTLHFFLWFYVLYFLFKAEPESKKLIFWSFAAVALLINIQGIQDGLSSHGSRPFATLGNATYIGFFNLLMMFISVYFLGVYRKDLFLQIIIGALMIISIATLLISQTRGSIMGAAAGIIVLAVYSIIASNKKIGIKILISGLLVLLILGFYLFLRTDFTAKIPGISRVSQSITQGKTLYMPRLISWGIFWEAFKTKPIFGFGLENSPDAYYRYFNPDMFKYEEVIFDRPHNKFLEIMVTQGIVGFILWVLFIFSAFYFLKFIRDKYLKGALLSFLAAYLVQNFTLFDMQASYLLFFFGLALFTLEKQETKTIQFKTSRDKQELAKNNIIISIAAVLLIAGLYLDFYHFYIVKNIIKNLTVQPDKAINGFYSLAGKHNPFLQEEAIILNNYINQNISSINKSDEINKIAMILKKAYEKDSLDLRVVNIYTAFLTMEIKAKANQSLDFAEEKAEAEKIFQNLLTQYPKFPDIYVNYSIFLSTIGEKQKALEVLKNGKDLFVKSKRLTYAIANIFENQGESAVALDFLQSAKKEGWEPQNLDMRLFLLRLLLKGKQFEEAKTEISNILKTDNSTTTIGAVNQTLKNSGYPHFAY